MDAFFRVLGFDCYDKHRFTELLDGFGPFWGYLGRRLPTWTWFVLVHGRFDRKLVLETQKWVDCFCLDEMGHQSN